MKSKNKFRGGKKSSFNKSRDSRGKSPDAEVQEEMRLNRFIAQAGICSRRNADILIETGKISINGKRVMDLGTKVNISKDEVIYNGKRLRIENHVYILFNKQKNTITTTSDPKGRPTVLAAIENATKARVYPVGRLDRNTTGLLLLTNDGILAKRLTHPSHNVKKLYHVTLDKPVEEEHLIQMLKGIELEDGIAKADKLDYVMGKTANHVGIQIHIGRNRIVRRMFESLGYSVKALDRVMIAHLTKKRLPRGKWRMLTDKEIGFLKMI